MVADDLRVAVKFQSNPEIAGSPRNNFRVSVIADMSGGKALNGSGADKVTNAYQTQNAGEWMDSSQTV